MFQMQAESPERTHEVHWEVNRQIQVIARVNVQT